MRAKANPSDGELLKFIAKEEPLAATLKAFPSLSRERIGKLLDKCAKNLSSNGEEANDAGALERVRVYSDGAARGNPGL